MYGFLLALLAILLTSMLFSGAFTMDAVWTFLQSISPQLAQGLLTIVAAFVAGIVAVLTAVIAHIMQRHREQGLAIQEERRVAYIAAAEKINSFAFTGYHIDVDGGYNSKNEMSFHAIARIALYGSNKTFEATVEFDSAIRDRRRLLKNVAVNHNDKMQRQRELENHDFRIKESRMALLKQMRLDLVHARPLEEVPKYLNDLIDKNTKLQRLVPDIEPEGGLQPQGTTEQ